MLVVVLTLLYYIRVIDVMHIGRLLFGFYFDVTNVSFPRVLALEIVKCLMGSDCQGNHLLTGRIFPWCKHKTAGIDLLPKSHNALVPYSTMHHFVIVSKWCIMGLSNALWDLLDGFMRLVNCTLPIWPEATQRGYFSLYILWFLWRQHVCLNGYFRNILCMIQFVLTV